jgi:hypothetical protein
MITRNMMDNICRMGNHRIRTPRLPLSAAYLADFNTRNLIVIGFFSFFLQLAFAQEYCKPLLPVDMPDNLPCAANIIGGNGPAAMNPPKAFERAREVIWDHFQSRVPSFVNLEVASREGALTRVVYVLGMTSDGKSFVVRWTLQRQVIDVVKQTANWDSIERFTATTVVRDAKTGVLTFLNGHSAVGHL